MKPCNCKDQKKRIAESSNVIPAEFGVSPSGASPLPTELAFLAENAGKYVCFRCGGELPAGDHFPIDGSTVCTRLRQLGILEPPLDAYAEAISRLAADATIAQTEPQR